MNGSCGVSVGVRGRMAEKIDGGRRATNANNADVAENPNDTLLKRTATTDRCLLFLPFIDFHQVTSVVMTLSFMLNSPFVLCGTVQGTRCPDESRGLGRALCPGPVYELILYYARPSKATRLSH